VIRTAYLCILYKYTDIYACKDMFYYISTHEYVSLYTCKQTYLKMGIYGNEGKAVVTIDTNSRKIRIYIIFYHDQISYKCINTYIYM
jgi:hypothetical protein